MLDNFTDSNARDRTGPTIATSNPSDGSSGFALGGTLQFTFNEAVVASTLTANASNTNCAGSVQLSTTVNDFSSCIQMNGQPTTSDNKTFSVTPNAALTNGVSYKLKITRLVLDSNDNNASSDQIITFTAGADVTAPNAATISQSGLTAVSVNINWTAVGDDGGTGTASSYQLNYVTGGACPTNDGTNFTSGTSVSGMPAPQAAGNAETKTVTLTASTQYCFVLRVADEVPNASFSNSLTFTTPANDTVAPDAATIATGTITSDSIQINWTAVGDDGSTGTATTHEIRYLTGATCPSNNGSTFTNGTTVTGMPAILAAGNAQTKTVTGLSQSTQYCFTLRVADELGNTSFSNNLTGTTPADTTAPSAAAISAGTITNSTIQINWNAVGDDAGTGTADNYQIRYLAGATCPANDGTNFTNGTDVAGEPTPQAAGNAETYTVSSLGSSSQYCISLRVADEAGNVSFSNNLTATTTGDTIATYLVISEVCHTDCTGGGGADDEYIELYNPTSSAIDLGAGGYRLYRDTSGGGAPSTFLCDFTDASHFNGGTLPTSVVVPARGYYLIVNDNGPASLTSIADAQVSDSRMIITSDNTIYLGTGPITTDTDTDITDKMGFGTAAAFEGGGAAFAVGSGQSIERKAHVDSTADANASTGMYVGGGDASDGNGQDTNNNNNDFVLRTSPQPQNRASATEP